MTIDKLFKDIEDKCEPENIAEGYEEVPVLSEFRREDGNDRKTGD